jgi:hypothetical protein
MTWQEADYDAVKVKMKPGLGGFVNLEIAFPLILVLIGVIALSRKRPA